MPDAFIRPHLAVRFRREMVANEPPLSQAQTLTSRGCLLAVTLPFADNVAPRGVGFDWPDRTHDTRVRTVWALLASLSAAQAEEVSESEMPFNVLGRNQIQSIPRAILRVATERQARCLNDSH